MNEIISIILGLGSPTGCSLSMPQMILVHEREDFDARENIFK